MRTSKKVGILGFLHESNTFLPVPTTWDDFASTSMTHGEAMRQRWQDSPHELGGMLSGCQEAIVPGLATFAVPSGTIDAASFERLADALVSSVDSAVDGLLVALHGATVSESYPDADGEVLRRLRARFGDSIPIIVTLDLHANVSQAMVRYATAIIAYRSNPHLDQRARGLEAAALMSRILHEGVRPAMAFEMPPLVIPIAAQHTSVAPARGLYDDLEDVLQWPDILSASVCLGFCYADVAEMGVSFLAIADDNLEAARRAARYMSQRAWDRRHEFLPVLPSPAQAVRDAMLSDRKPVVLMDVGDNTGGGSSAASTVLFEECVRQGASNVLVLLHDPLAVAACVAAGVRNQVQLPLVTGRVRTLSDGLFTETQVRHGGWTHCDQGITAVVETDEGGHTVVFTTRRMAPMSLEQLLSLGIHPERKDILIVKGVIAPRAAYEPVAASIVLVDTPGPTANDPASFDYKHRRRPLFPIEKDTEPL